MNRTYSPTQTQIAEPTMNLIDAHGRKLDYVRLALTDRCNLRCSYCMPACGIDFVSREALLSYEEMFRILSLLSTVGVTKMRLTGGEPFVRKGAMEFIEKIHEAQLFQQIHLTTNATLTRPYTQRMIHAGIKTVNVSLDTLDRDRFMLITRRDELNEVLFTIEDLMNHGVHIKINMVVMAGVNEQDILPMAELARNKNISVRFLEEMPFNGSGEAKRHCFNHQDILQILEGGLGKLTKIPSKHGDTSSNFTIDGFKGNLGIIASYSRTFCGTCNRLRITPIGIVKTCLYDDGSLDLRDYLRNGSSDNQILSAISDAVKRKAKDGFEAEVRRSNLVIDESMASIGG